MLSVGGGRAVSGCRHSDYRNVRWIQLQPSKTAACCRNRYLATRGRTNNVSGNTESGGISIGDSKISVPASRRRSERVELWTVLVVVLLGGFVRFWQSGLETVEHFDEGVYASVLWYDSLAGKPWPSREFFAPPGLPFLIEMASLLPGCARIAPFLPAMVFGSLTPLALWWTARAWYGRSAGFFALLVSAGSDYHILYSRMALTDVPVMFFIVLSVALGSIAVFRSSGRLAILSGIACGCGWWIKYTGWLPLAILLSGSTSWWLFSGRRSHSLLSLIKVQSLMVASSFLVFFPCWWSLLEVGGYRAVASSHSGYLNGFSAWSATLAAQLAFQFRMDGIVGASSLGLGFAIAGVYRCLAGLGFTWNAVERGALQHGERLRVLHICRLIGRVLVVSLAISIVALRARTPLLLCCMSVGGLAGMYLWPLTMLTRRQSSGKGQSSGAESVQVLEARGMANAQVDPALGFWINVAWLAGMLLVTPLYHPYSRLMFPLMTAVWLAAAGAVSWWLEANINAGASPESEYRGLSPLERIAGRITTGLLALALLASFLVMGPDGGLNFVPESELLSTRLFRDRHSIQTIAGRIASTCAASTEGIDVHPRTVITGEVFTASSLEGKRKNSPELPLRDTASLRLVPMVIYGYGEPALLMHLSETGAMALPVGYVNLPSSADSSATFLVLGPNAWRTPGFSEEWSLQEQSYDWIGDFDYRPGEITLMDLYSADFLARHNDVQTQRFEVYRRKSP